MHCFGLFYSFFRESTWESLLKCYSLSTWLASHQPRPCSLQKSFITDSNWENQSLTTSTSAPPPQGGWELGAHPYSCNFRGLVLKPGCMGRVVLSFSFPFFSFQCCCMLLNLPRPLASHQADNHQGALEWAMVRIVMPSLLSDDILSDVTFSPSVTAAVLSIPTLNVAFVFSYVMFM